MVGLPSEHQAKAVLTKAAHEFLTELASFPEKALQRVDQEIQQMLENARLLAKAAQKLASFFAISGLKDRLEVKIGGQHDHVANGNPAWPCQHEHHHIGHLARFN